MKTDVAFFTGARAAGAFVIACTAAASLGCSSNKNAVDGGSHPPPPPTADATVDGSSSSSTDGGGMHWVGTWANGPQLVEMANLPPAPGLTNNTLRQELYVSIGGSQLRVRFSNAYGDGPVTMNAVHIAVSKGMSTIDPTTDQALMFSGSPSVTIMAGDTIWSDPFSYTLPPLTTMAVTIAFGATPTNITGHPGSRTTSFLTTGNDMSTVTAASFPASAATTAHWYYLTGIDVMAGADTNAAVILGDSITDGRGSDTDGNDRWPDDLSRRLQAMDAGAVAGKVAVLNEGIGGNAVLTGGLGPPAVQRFKSDVLGQSGAKWLVIFEGVNDIGGSPNVDAGGPSLDAGTNVASEIIAAFTNFIDMAHGAGMRAYGIPITPFGGNTSYDSPDHQAERQAVNDWIINGGKFDAVINLDPVVADPSNQLNLNPAYDSGDGLHLNPAGYHAMANAIDLTLF